MSVTLGCGTSIVSIHTNWIRVSDTQFDVYLNDKDNNKYITSAQWFSFDLKDFGRYDLSDIIG